MNSPVQMDHPAGRSQTSHPDCQGDEKAMNTPTAITHRTTETLRAAISGEVFVPGDLGYDQARQAWNLTADQRPSVDVFAESAGDVVHAVRFARAQGMRIAPQGTRHGSQPLESLEGAMLLRAYSRGNQEMRRR